MGLVRGVPRTRAHLLDVIRTTLESVICAGQFFQRGRRTCWTQLWIDICEEVVKRGGGQMGKEPHNKARVRAKGKIQAARAAEYSSSSGESDSESSDSESDSESE